MYFINDKKMFYETNIMSQYGVFLIFIVSKKIPFSKDRLTFYN